MKYFEVSVDTNYVPPALIEWWGIIDKKTLSHKRAFQMPKNLIFQVEDHMQMVFTDIITFPCLLVSQTVMDVIKMYDSDISSVRIVLFDKSRKRSKLYYLPFLDTVEYHSSNVNARTPILSINKKYAEERVVMRTENADKTAIIMRMDLVESILRRETTGIGLKEVQLVEGEDK